MQKPLEYLNNLQKILETIISDQLDAIEACSKAFAETLENNHNIFLFGTGHSHMLVQDPS